MWIFHKYKKTIISLHEINPFSPKEKNILTNFNQIYKFKLQITRSPQSLIHFFQAWTQFSCSFAQLLEWIPFTAFPIDLPTQISFDTPLSTIVSRFNKLPPLAPIVYAPYRGSRRFIYRGQNLIVVPPLRKDANERETSSGKHGYTDTRPRYLYNLFVYLSGAYTTDTGHVAIMDAGERDGIHLIKRTIE